MIVIFLSGRILQAVEDDKAGSALRGARYRGLVKAHSLQAVAFAN